MLLHPQATSADHGGSRTSDLSIERRRRNHFTTAPLICFCRNKKMSEELIRMRDENRDLKRVINDKDLNKKQLDMKMLDEAESKLEEAEKKNEVSCYINIM